jgi:cytochrome o ubiquinol oxidase subunit IV
MQNSRHRPEATATPYLVGGVLALALTVIPFGLVAKHALPLAPTFAVIAVAAIAQIVVHLRFFLHLDLKSSSQENLLTLCFTAVLIVLMAGGTIWIMFDLNARMM